jgi:hypothetical protein
LEQNKFAITQRTLGLESGIKSDDASEETQSVNKNDRKAMDDNLVGLDYSDSASTGSGRGSSSAMEVKEEIQDAILKSLTRNGAIKEKSKQSATKTKVDLFGLERAKEVAASHALVDYGSSDEDDKE